MYHHYHPSHAVLLDPPIVFGGMLIRVIENVIYECVMIERACRLVAYRQFIHWTYSRLGRGMRRVIPSCVVAAVRHEFPEADGVYTGFKLAEL